MVRERVWEVLSVVLLAVGGVLLGAATVVVQAYRSEVAGRSLQWGLVVSLLAVGAAVRGACWWARRRSAGAVVGAGWVLATVVLARTGPGGDVLLPDGPGSFGYLLGGVALVIACLLVPLPPNPAGPAGDEPAAATAQPEDGR